MATSGQDDLVKAVRALLLTSTAISAAGVYHRVAPREDALPYVLFSLTPLPLVRTFRSTAIWLHRLEVKVCAAAKGNSTARAIAKPLKDAAYTLLTVADDDGTPKDKLSALLASAGFKSLELIEGPDMEPYSDVIVEGVERWHYGSNFDLRIGRL